MIFVGGASANPPLVEQTRSGSEEISVCKKFESEENRDGFGEQCFDHILEKAERYSIGNKAHHVWAQKAKEFGDYVAHSSAEEKGVTHHTCEDWCSGTGWGFGCAPCEPSWFNLMKEQCFAPGPFGTGLLCTENPQTGEYTSSCCGEAGSGKPCVLPKGGCDCKALGIQEKTYWRSLEAERDFIFDPFYADTTCKPKQAETFTDKAIAWLRHELGIKKPDNDILSPGDGEEVMTIVTDGSSTLSQNIAYCSVVGVVFGSFSYFVFEMIRKRNVVGTEANREAFLA